MHKCKICNLSYESKEMAERCERFCSRNSACRPDLKKKTLIGGILFLGLYFAFFLSFNFIYPSAVEQFWNLSAISGILFLGIPIEELLFAFAFGMMWAGVYEHVKWYGFKRR